MTAHTLDQPAWQEMRDQASTAAHAITTDRPLFALRIEWPGSYQQLLAGTDAERSDESILLDHTLQSGRVLLASEAGSGKTWLIARLITQVLESDDLIPVLIQLKNLSTTEPVSQKDGLEPIINRLWSIATPDPRLLLATSGPVPSLILMVDGLNEVPRDVAEPVIAAVDELARRYPFLSVLITDRIVRRPIDLIRWKLATILPLTEDVIQRAWADARVTRALPENLSLLERPFFLDNALSTDITADTESESIEAYFTQRVRVSPKDLDRLAKTAFVAYANYHGRTMPEPWLRARVSRSIFRRLLETDTVRTSRQRAWFTHHLLHDFLAARSLTARKPEWGPEAFDTVTLRAASFDSLRLTVEQLPDTTTADEFIRRVYDWNYYGAAYALVPGHVSEETHTVILAMLADKKWDPVRATIVQVTDALRFDASDTARQLLQARSRSGLFKIVRNLDSTVHWFTEWVTLFTTPDDAIADEAMITGLQTEDSIISWTLANVLRRCHIDATGMTLLLGISWDTSAVVRWRAVHVLGAHPSEQTAKNLEDHITQDRDNWVRYGAVRSIVEVASRTEIDSRTEKPSLRASIFATLMQLVQSHQLDDSILRELGRALDIRPQPEGWAESVAPIVQQLLGASETLVEQDKWGRVMASILRPDSDE